MDDRDYIKYRKPGPDDERALVERRFEQMKFDRCPASTKSSPDAVYYRREIEGDEAWVIADSPGKIAVNWPFVKSLQAFALTKGLNFTTKTVLGLALYDIQTNLEEDELKQLLTEWQDYRRKSSIEVKNELYPPDK